MAYEVRGSPSSGGRSAAGPTLPDWAWGITDIVVEAADPDRRRPHHHGRVGSSALIAPSRPRRAHAYYFFIILSALKLRPMLCFFDRRWPALGFAAATWPYTFLTHTRSSRDADGPAYPLQIFT